MVAHFTLRTYDINEVFFRKKIGFDDSIDVTKCLKQIEMSDLLHMYTLCSELPFGISTMIVASVYLNIKARFIKDSCTSIFVYSIIVGNLLILN